ncbi:tyrosine-type recombinase/integrase [uncultured Friedmanniella sp.]|uniref:tyrosine-type recombinase/integrase n=1 Tax=uncultured Friedmanniella sp. TaxID=335381 RepID=UPI0035CBBAF2
MPARTAEDLWSAAELERREAEVRIRPGSAFMTSPEGGVDAVLTSYFNSAPFLRLADATQESYLKDYRLFFDFLWRRSRSWSEATRDDVEDYEDWRRRAPTNPRRVGGSKWMRELAALNRLYQWAVATGQIAANPVATRVRVTRDGQMVQTLDAAAHDVVTADVKWLTPRAWSRWRDVGLLGLDASGLPDGTFRGRNGDRNAAYADLLFDSGLRRTEGASLLVLELPAVAEGSRYQRGRLATAVAKNGSGRPFYVTTATLRRIGAYLATSRADAVRAAQEAGRYDRVPGKLLVEKTGLAPVPVLRWVDEATGTAGEGRLDRLPVPLRERLFVRGPDGLEPAWLWVGEDGMPFQGHSWEAVFSAASKRCRRLLGPGAPFCTPHMARHSFALTMLVALQHVLDTRFGLDAEQRRDFAALYGNPWRMVKDLLGHRSEDTTRNIYLAPVQDVQIRSLLEGDLAAGAEFLQAVAAASGRVQDVAPSGGR